MAKRTILRTNLAELDIDSCPDAESPAQRIDLSGFLDWICAISGMQGRITFAGVFGSFHGFEFSVFWGNPIFSCEPMFSHFQIPLTLTHNAPILFSIVFININDLGQFNENIPENNSGNIYHLSKKR